MMSKTSKRPPQRTHEQQHQVQMAKMINEADVLIALKADDETGRLNVTILPRDAVVNQHNAAVIFASFVNANFKQLAGQAIAMHNEWVEQQNAQKGEAIAAAPVRSILDQHGNLASNEPPQIIVTGGACG
jgi:hypothetical protein